MQLIRGKRNFTRTAVYAAPKPFLFIALNASGSARLSTHLVRPPCLFHTQKLKLTHKQNDQIFISHKHQQEDGLPNLEDLRAAEPPSEDNASTSSVIRSSPYPFQKRKQLTPLFSLDELHKLTQLTQDVRISSEVRAYLHNIVVFLRLHHAVDGGISAMATRHISALAQYVSITTVKLDDMFFWILILVVP
jgi:hypothetical protein